MEVCGEVDITYSIEPHESSGLEVSMQRTHGSQSNHRDAKSGGEEPANPTWNIFLVLVCDQA